jgi:RimJ/RimL family protein N-acetyltransferase
MERVWRVRAVDETDVASVTAFLERHMDTSMFMLNNLTVNGVRLSSALNSGNWKLIEEKSDICGVFYLTRRTTILAETGGRTEFAQAIVDACSAESIPVGGVVGEWKLAEAIWAIFRRSPGFAEAFASKEILQACDLRPVKMDDRASHVRQLRIDDFEQWDRLNGSSCAEEGIPRQSTPAEREAHFRLNAGARLWWGYFDSGELVSMACLNAVYKNAGQVGGVYTVPACRRRGLSRAVMNALLNDSVHVHRLQRLILFTGEHNHAARHLYDTLGFSTIGSFAIFMCAPIL